MLGLSILSGIVYVAVYCRSVMLCVNVLCSMGWVDLYCLCVNAATARRTVKLMVSVMGVVV